ncbi:MAG TPA: endolytic transglycosylase MltG, partial [Candidatus Acidoferrales bacterium]|nr:endolytic transglycosylase MltG [Candidatus Acidoferrales bacterium]
AAAHDTSLISDLAPHAKTLEGFLFPSTYQFTRHTTCKQVAATMVRHFRAIWETLQVPRFPQLPLDITPEDAVTVASLVERETPNGQERPLVASVFYNRLRKDIPLQCDATIQYALLLKGRAEGDVKHADLSVDSPYNTYQHRGLPPGPIANPGEASLKAALAPEPSDYLYFVANDHGGHFFSKTLQEHNRNVARLRRMLNDDAAQGVPSNTPE